MSESAIGRSAIMTIRVWIDTDGSFRARLLTTDHGSHDVSGKAVARPQDVVEEVRRWLDSFVTGSD
jgi:hypothetical protein